MIETIGIVFSHELNARTVLESAATSGLVILFYSTCATPCLALSVASAVTAIAAVLTSSPLLHRISRVFSRIVLASLLCNATIHPLLHEGGHALLATLFYKSPQIKIALNTLNASTTYSTHGGLTILGSLFGPEWVPIIIAAGGFLGSLAWGILATPPILVYSGMARLLSEASYALTALRLVGWHPAHDYQYLWVYANITPLAPAAILLGAFGYKFLEAINC